MKSSKIVGVVQCRNEWGLIAVSISYALENHVDEVYVLNDASNDQTANGLMHLQKIWTDRLHVINVIDIGFQQEAMTNTVAHIAQLAGAEWIYVFDADEFLVIKKETSLRKIIDGLHPSVSLVRYRLENFISMQDFDECDLASYTKLLYRSEPAAGYDPELISQKIHQGEATFFDAPFPSKVIFRYSELLRLRAGSHRVIFYGTGLPAIDESRIRSVHLPLLTRKRLTNKARMGEGHIKDGFDARYGWQNQLIYRLETEDRLEWFWSRHSIPSNGIPNALTPKFSVDHGLSQSIEPTLQILRDAFASPNTACVGLSPIECSIASETLIPVHQAFKLAVTLQAQADIAQKIRKHGLMTKLQRMFT